MTDLQRQYIESLRLRLKVSPAALDQVCQKRFGSAVTQLDVRQASQLIDALKDPELIKRELLLAAGQQSMFGGAA